MHESNDNRVLTEEDFAFLRRGMSLTEIEAVVGEKSGTVGFGLISPFYQLDNGTLVLMFSSPIGVEYENLVYFIIRYTDGSRKKVDLHDTEPC